MSKAKSYTFDQALSLFKRSGVSHMRFARLCSEMAFKHYAEHGQVALLQRFMDAMPANFLRKQAFVAWVIAHAPLKLNAGKFESDRSAAANQLNLNGAMHEPFWDYSPEKPVLNASATTIIEALNATIKRFEGERYKLDDGARDMLAKAKNVVLTLVPNTGSNLPAKPAETVTLTDGTQYPVPEAKLIPAAEVAKRNAKSEAKRPAA